MNDPIIYQRHAITVTTGPGTFPGTIWTLYWHRPRTTTKSAAQTERQATVRAKQPFAGQWATQAWMARRSYASDNR